MGRPYLDRLRDLQIGASHSESCLTLQASGLSVLSGLETAGVLWAARAITLQEKNQ
ncbi:MAG: hypothetical protein K6T90_22180 [Leptolyngbyaceae cyanobacterium HOT.MB2.61]|nr:hypothetical protein [Leptolyngbyaceae cyanobacterium HOT.MB2.61]